MIWAEIYVMGKIRNTIFSAIVDPFVCQPPDWA